MVAEALDLLVHFKIPFEEVVIAMDRPETRAAMLRYVTDREVPLAA